MILLILSFFAGVLTILAPCILPVLPIILGAGVQDKENKWKPYIIIFSLSISIILFSLLLKATTLLIDVPQNFWKIVSGGIIIFFGIITLFPDLWKNFSTRLGFSDSSNKILGKSSQKKGYMGDILVGASLGPVFSSCSPTYALILATILPAGFFFGLLNLIAYSLGLAVVLLGIVLMGRKFTSKLQGLSDPKSLFKKALGVLFLIVGIAIIFGFDKDLEAAILKAGFFNTAELEYKILEQVQQK